MLLEASCVLLSFQTYTVRAFDTILPVIYQQQNYLHKRSNRKCLKLSFGVDNLPTLNVQVSHPFDLGTHVI